MHKDNLFELLENIQASMADKIAERRSLTMDVCQALLEGSQYWPLIRKRLLGFFGESGLEADLLEVIECAKAALQAGVEK